MEALSNLDTFVKILTEKGYDGLFHMEGTYVGRLKDGLREYLENCPSGVCGTSKKDLLLSCYLQWKGEYKPRVECSMWVKRLNGKFFLYKMLVAKKDRLGQLLKRTELKSLSVVTAPKAVDAIALVHDTKKHKGTMGRRGKS